MGVGGGNGCVTAVWTGVAGVRKNTNMEGKTSLLADKQNIRNELTCSDK